MTESAKEVYGELTPSERAALIIRRLDAGETLTTAEIARVYGISQDGAYQLLCRLSRKFAIVHAPRGKWRMNIAGR